MIVKVVYFDEGHSEQKTEQINERTSRIAAKADASAEAGLYI